jgi:hypothetical protein
VEGIIIVPIHGKGDKTGCNNYQGISLLSIAYKILSNIHPAKLTPYTNEIIGDHQYEFHHNSSTTDHSLDTKEKMGVQWDSVSAIYRLQESL